MNNEEQWLIRSTIALGGDLVQNLDPGFQNRTVLDPEIFCRSELSILPDIYAYQVLCVRQVAAPLLADV